MEGDHVYTSLFPQAEISIHALRVEGDPVVGITVVVDIAISIHALRVEGDVTLVSFITPL